jgi:hypothetical protein
MQKDTSLGYLSSIVFKVLAFAVVIAASFHIAISVISAFTKHHLYYLNPIRFLGVNNFWPKYQNSDSATIISWAILFTIYAFLLVRYVKKNDPHLASRVKSTISYNNETRRLTLATKNDNEIDLLPLNIFIKNFYRVKDFILDTDTRI